MLEKVAAKLTKHMIEKEVVPADDEEVYIYGWSLILSHLASIVTMLLLAAFSREMPGTLIFMAFFFSLRTYAGGYHANTYLKCYLISMSIYLFALLTALFLPVHLLQWALLMLLFCVLTNFICAPADHPNKPLKEDAKRRNKIKSRIIVSIQTITISALWFLLPDIRHYLLWAMLGMTMTSMTLLYVTLNPYEENPDS